jgi:AcrR family transcriptional regulator
MSTSAAAPTKRRILEAAQQTLADEGFAGTSARTIARTGSFNQALIFYHYGSVKQLLLAVLDASAARRLGQYESVFGDASSLVELARGARALYFEDIESGHVSIVTQLIAGSTGDPEFSREVAKRALPFHDFARATIERLLEGSPLSALMPASAMASAIIAMYLGFELLSSLDGDQQRAEALFDAAERAAPLFDALLRPGAAQR